jgi:hypothetical protein
MNFAELFLETKRSRDPDHARIFAQIHDAAFELSAIAGSARAETLSALLMKAAHEAERLKSLHASRPKAAS